MPKSFFEIEHKFSLNSSGLQQFAEQLGCNMENNTSVNFPSEIAAGSAGLIKVQPDVWVFIIDVTLNKPIRFTRIPMEEDCWILYYDLSDHYSRHIVDGVKHTIGYKAKLGFAVMDSRIKSSYISDIGDRAYSLRIVIKKSFLNKYLREKGFIENFWHILGHNGTFFYGQLDARSKVMLYNLKKHKMNSFNYEFLLKSTTYNLLGYFFERLNINAPLRVVYEKDRKAILMSNKFLLSNLVVPFPGIEKLAEIANMSVTKYKYLYKSIFGMTPAVFFKNEKLLLARELLESGNFKTVGEVAFLLGYQKLSYFSMIYINQFGIYPVESLQTIKIK